LLEELADFLAEARKCEDEDVKDTDEHNEAGEEKAHPVKDVGVFLIVAKVADEVVFEWVDKGDVCEIKDLRARCVAGDADEADDDA